VLCGVEADNAAMLTSLSAWAAPINQALVGDEEEVDNPPDTPRKAHTTRLVNTASGRAKANSR
jgi:hypothetical protein